MDNKRVLLRVLVQRIPRSPGKERLPRRVLDKLKINRMRGYGMKNRKCIPPKDNINAYPKDVLLQAAPADKFLSVPELPATIDKEGRLLIALPNCVP